MEFDFTKMPSIDEVHSESMEYETTEFGQGITQSIHNAPSSPMEFNLGETANNSEVQQSFGDNYSVKNLAQHSGFVGMADRYLDKRYGSSRERGETNEDVIEEFLTYGMRISRPKITFKYYTPYIRTLLTLCQRVVVVLCLVLVIL